MNILDGLPFLANADSSTASKPFCLSPSVAAITQELKKDPMIAREFLGLLAGEGSALLDVELNSPEAYSIRAHLRREFGMKMADARAYFVDKEGRGEHLGYMYVVGDQVIKGSHFVQFMEAAYGLLFKAPNLNTNVELQRALGWLTKVLQLATLKTYNDLDLEIFADLRQVNGFNEQNIADAATKFAKKQGLVNGSPFITFRRSDGADLTKAEVEAVEAFFVGICYCCPEPVNILPVYSTLTGNQALAANNEGYPAYHCRLGTKLLMSLENYGHAITIHTQDLLARR